MLQLLHHKKATAITKQYPFGSKKKHEKHLKIESNNWKLFSEKKERKTFLL